MPLRPSLGWMLALAACAAVLSAAAVAAALDRYAEAGDFTDHLHVALAAEAGATRFATFDRNLSASTGSAIAVESL